MDIIKIVNAETGIINPFIEGEFKQFIDKSPIRIPNYDYIVDKNVRKVFENSKSDAFLFYERNNKIYPIEISEEDFNNYITKKIDVVGLRKKYKIRLSSKDDMPKIRSKSREDEESPKEFIREDISDPKLIVDGSELKESKKLGQGSFGSVFYDHEAKTVTKTSKILGTTILEFIAIKENPMFKDHGYQIDLRTIGNFIIKSKISGEQTLSKIPVPKNVNSRKIARLILDMLLQLKYLHSLGIYHRDIKGDNTLVSKQDGNYIAHFIDFGMAYIDVGQDDKNNHASSAYCAESRNTNFLKLKQFRDIEKSDVCGLGFGIVYWLTNKKVFPFVNFTDPTYNKLYAEYITKKKQGITYEEHRNKLKKPVSYNLENSTKENLSNEIIVAIDDIPSPDMLDFIWNMCNPNIQDRYTVDQLIYHPYVSSYGYKNYMEQYPFVPYPSKDIFTVQNPSLKLKEYLNMARPNIKKNVSMNVYHHTINLMVRYFNYMSQNDFINDKHLRHIGQACLIISICRIVDYFQEILNDDYLISYTTNPDIKALCLYISHILNVIDCRCGIYESEVFNFDIPKPVPPPIPPPVHKYAQPTYQPAVPQPAPKKSMKERFLGMFN